MLYLPQKDTPFKGQEGPQSDSQTDKPHSKFLQCKFINNRGLTLYLFSIRVTLDNILWLKLLISLSYRITF